MFFKQPFYLRVFNFYEAAFENVTKYTINLKFSSPKNSNIFSLTIIQMRFFHFFLNKVHRMVLISSFLKAFLRNGRAVECWLNGWYCCPRKPVHCKIIQFVENL